MRYKIFISSVQNEFANERLHLEEYIKNDALFRKYFDVFIFESLSAQDRKAHDIYIDEVKNCDIYLGLIGKEFGFEFEDGSSPTQQEFYTATQHNKYRLIFLLNAEKRNSKVNQLIATVSESLIYGRFSSYSELVSDVYASLITFLVEKGELRTEPFDKSVNLKAQLSDISDDTIDWFLRKAKTERGLALDINTSKEKLLTHLNLFTQGKLSNAAILLFGIQPQRFFITSEVKCAHFHGLNVEKPIPYYQVFKGNLFELVNQAVNFVLSKIDYAVGTRSESVVAPTAYEIPPAAIEEAIVNAIAHRDYDSTASVQVMLFSDRLEIRNPGQLPPALTFEALKKDHSSYPRNPLIAESMYLTKYIERMGTGIQEIIKNCIEYGLPEPDFKMTDTFVTTIYRKKGIAFEKVGGTFNDQVSDEGISVIDMEQEKVTEKVTENQIKILTCIEQNASITSVELSLKLGISDRKVKENIKKLKLMGKLKRIGPDKGGYWEVVSN